MKDTIQNDRVLKSIREKAIEHIDKILQRSNMSKKEIMKTDDYDNLIEGFIIGYITATKELISPKIN